MEPQQICPECGAHVPEGSTCQDYFSQMLAWENEKPENGQVHHLTVLCYYMQHPSLYSPDGLREAKHLLVEFVENGVSPQEMRQRSRDRVDSGKRKWKIKATAESKGAYLHPIQWKMTAADVVANGIDMYCNSVRAWARSMLDLIRASGNLSSE